MFVVVVDDKTGKVVKRYSYGPQGGFWNRGSLISVTGSRNSVDRVDNDAWNTYSTDPDAASEQGISVVPIDASDDAVITSGDAMDNRLGTRANPGPVPYYTIPEEDLLFNAANSNSAAYGVADDAVKSENPERSQPLPRGTRNPGWGSHRNIPRGARPPVARGPIASSCRGTRVGNAKTGSIC